MTVNADLTMLFKGIPQLPAKWGVLLIGSPGQYLDMVILDQGSNQVGTVRMHQLNGRCEAAHPVVPGVALLDSFIEAIGYLQDPRYSDTDSAGRPII